MNSKSQFTTIFLIFVLCLNLINVTPVLADDGLPPTDQPVATEETPEVDPLVVEESPAAETPPAPEETPEQTPTTEETVVDELLPQLPENTNVVVLGQEGEIVPLATQEALNVISDTDPMWCPAGVLPGGAGCTTNFATIALLLTDMRNNTGTYDQHGVIYFTANPGASFSLTTAAASLGTGDFNTLNDFNLTLQGGWNGLNGASATFITQTNFGTNSLSIGSSSNPWVGNLTLNNFLFNGVSSTNALTLYTTSGNVTLNNVDVAQQAGGNYTAFIDSNSGNITVQNGSSFDGNNSGGNSNQNRGFSAETNSGNITITNTTFSDAKGCLNLFVVCVDALANYNGATLSASSVVLTNVTANNNDLSGIEINNANSVTLNNVTANNNGTLIVGSGVHVNGTGSTLVNINGGAFSNNMAYGVSVFNGTLNVTSPIVSCNGNNLGCTNDAVPPVLSLPSNIIVEATGPSGAVVTYSASANDNVNGSRSVTCSRASGSTFPIATTTVNCSASDINGNTANGSFTVTVRDTTAPVIAAHANISQEATNAAGGVVTYTSPTTSDIVDGTGTASCSPSSGSTFGLGITTVTCNATDARGNIATPNTFTVNIVDTTPPVIAPQSNITQEATSAAGRVVTYTNPSTSDAVDGAGIASCLPVSGSTFSLGSTTVTCNATDSHGNNAASTNFIVNIVDTTAPIIAEHTDVTQEATSAAGSLVTYTNPSTSDAVDGTGTASCLPASGSTFSLGSTTVTCNATDSHGNVANATTFTVYVGDTTPPTISSHANIYVSTQNEDGAIVHYLAPQTFDAVDGVGVAVCTPPSGTRFPLGTTYVICTAMDSHENSATPIRFAVKVDEMNTATTNGTGNGILIPATGGSFLKLDCTAPDSFRVNMAGARIIFNNLCDYEAFINNLEQLGLPGELPNGSQFVDGYAVNISKDGKSVNPLPQDASVAIEFNVPSNLKGADFAVLYWNGSQWAEISGEMTESGQFMVNITAEIANSNTFIFVTK